MASLQTGCCNTKEAPMKPGQWKLTLRCIPSVETSQHVAASVGQHSFENNPLGTTQRCCNVLPGNDPENSVIVREALRMNLPHHLVLRNVQRRVQTCGADYADVKELVSDLFTSSLDNQEVPMETNQLEEALMMNSVVVMKALQKGVPPHLIKPKVRAKILCNKVGYIDVNELLTDLNVK
ncbi:uncharacterized protein ABDE67_020157 [Symphorus nematophorus]